MRLEISALLLGPQSHLDTDRVAEYVKVLDRLPPVIVFDTPDGLLLVDGHHRVAAAQDAGRTEVEADVRQGSRMDALRWLEAVKRHSGGCWT